MTTPSALPVPSPEAGSNSAAPDAAAFAFLHDLIERSRAIDGQPPFSDGSLVELRRGERRLQRIGHSAAAIVSASEAEFAVTPDARGRGLGTQLLEAILAASTPGLLIWAHGDHPAARALAASHRLTPVRRLLQLRRPVPEPEPELEPGQKMPLPNTPALSTPPQITAHSFRPGIDDAAWLSLNARAFASHPEQGSLTRDGLDELKREPWFDEGDFLLLRREGDREGDRESDRESTPESTPESQIVAFCWLKIEDGIGEFYVVGVDPSSQGEGLGRALMTAGFARLANRGIRTAALYVEADNVAAVNLYRSLGFADHSVDIQYLADSAPEPDPR